MKYTFVLLILCASCTFKKTAQVPPAKISPSPTSTATVAGLRLKPVLSTTQKDQDKELEKISNWFEQMDAVLREGLWVIRKERAPQGKSIFGKMQRALTIERNMKLANKSMFRCDVYSMTRNVQGLGGFPQSAESFHKCSSKESFAKFGEWNHPNADELEMSFDGSNLAEVLGMATGIFNPKIRCKLKSNPAGIIERFSCDNLMFDYNPAKSQVLKFKRFEFVKAGKQILHMRAEVLENLEPVRKIEADVPVEGAIQVTETVLKAPYVAPTPVPANAAALSPAPARIREGAVPHNDPNSNAHSSIREVPVRQNDRGGEAAGAGRGGEGRPIPMEELASPGPLMPEPGVAGPGALGAPVPREQQEGEYHEGGLLPAEQAAQQRQQYEQQQRMQNQQQGGGAPITVDPRYQQQPAAPVPGTFQQLPQGVEPMPEAGQRPR